MPVLLLFLEKIQKLVYTSACPKYTVPFPSITAIVSTRDVQLVSVYYEQHILSKQPRHKPFYSPIKSY